MLPNDTNAAPPLGFGSNAGLGSGARVLHAVQKRLTAAHWLPYINTTAARRAATRRAP